MLRRATCSTTGASVAGAAMAEPMTARKRPREAIENCILVMMDELLKKEAGV